MGYTAQVGTDGIGVCGSTTGEYLKPRTRVGVGDEIAWKDYIKVHWGG